MLTNLSQLETKIEQKTYKMLVDMDAPLIHVKEALFQFLKYIGQVEDAVKAQKDKADAEAASAAVVVPVETKVE